MGQRHVDDLLDAYALGALEPDEVAQVERHLEECPTCRALAEDARQTGEALLYAAPVMAPPPELRARLLARIAAEKAEASVESAESVESVERPAPPRTDPAAAQPAPEPPGTLLGRWMRGLRGQVPATRVAETLLRDLLADPACIVRPLSATAAAPRANARLVTAPGRRAGVLVAGGLPDPGAGRAYQVWLLRGGQPLPNALFTVSRAGTGASVIEADLPWQAFETVAVTPEPRSGSPAPTGPIVLAGQLA